MARIALLILAALAVSSSEIRSERRGPPLICYPIDIGSAKTLPYGRDPESRPAKQGVIDETQRILAASDDALVHMETLRRAYEILGSEPTGGLHGPAPAKPEVLRFGAVLKDAALAASLRNDPDAPPSRAEALAWFDLGYFLAIKENCLHGRDLLGDLSCHPILERAADFAPKDASLQFGVAFGQLHNDIEGPDANDRQQTTLWHSRGRRHLQTALDLTTDPASLLAKNVCALLADLGPFGQPTTLEAVRARFGLGAATSRNALQTAKVGTIDALCKDLILVRLVAPGDPPDPHLRNHTQPIAAGELLDVIGPDRTTYVARVQVLGNASTKTLACKVNVVTSRGLQPGDVVISGLN